MTGTVEKADRSKPHVLIIGAGLTGLLVAHGLQQNNISFTIFEKEDEDIFRPREWSMGVHWGVPLMEKLLPKHLVDRFVSEATVDPSLDYTSPPCNGSRIYDGKTGRVFKELETDGKMLRFSRRKLRTLIKEGVDIQYGHSLADITYSSPGSVTAHFTNGSTHTGTVVLGADGPRSLVRSLLFSSLPAAESMAQPMPGIVTLTATFSYHDAAKAQFVRSSHPISCMSLHPSLFTYLCVQDVPDATKPEDWTFVIYLNWLSDQRATLSEADARALVMQKASEVAEPFRSTILWIPDDVPLKFVDIGGWVARPWDSRDGRVSLAGDAAHPMPPHRGQGFNQAIQDAFNFVETMKKVVGEGGDGGQAVREYGDEVARRGAEETKLTTKNAYMLLSYDDFKNSPYMKHGLSKQA